MVHPVRFERTALCSEDRCSNPLSYGCTTDDIVPFISSVSYNNDTVNVQTNIPLSTLTTMRLGGNASYVAEVTTPEQLQQVYQNAKKMNQPVYVIGGGSNLIAHDDGFAGVIILNKIPGIDIIADDTTSTTVRAGGGEIWDNLVKFTVDRNLAGIEAMSGIPGTVGAAPVQNIGAYGQELADTFISLEAYDTTTDSFVTLSWEDCGFSYRHSIFRGDSAGRYIISAVTLALDKRVPEPPFYESLQKYLDANDIHEYNVQTIRVAVLAVRENKLPDPAKLPNAGSFFKNAIVEQWKVDELRKEYPDIPTFAVDDKHVKIPAGWLIEQCELKGQVINGMKVHDGNAVVLINDSATSYADLAAAREEIIGAVRDKFQIVLQQEPLELNGSINS
jgi:UDP-N-acetylmuramate dehydrogenase